MIAPDSFKNLSHQDLQKTFSVCEQLHVIPPGVSFVQHCYAVFGEAIDSIHHSMGHHLKAGFQVVDQVIDTMEKEWEEVHRGHVLEHPCAQRILARTTADVEAVHRVPGYKKFLKTTLYNEFYDRAQSQHLMWLTTQDSGQVFLAAFGRDKFYSEKELAQLQIIQPHLHSAWKNWMLENTLKKELATLKNSFFRTPEEEQTAAAIRRQIEGLPPRQRQVVELIAAGMDNQQISDELKISVLTVKKHLQVIFQSMKVQHRTELAAKWHQGHSVPIR